MRTADKLKFKPNANLEGEKISGNQNQNQKRKGENKHDKRNDDENYPER